jgi:hypothetical protein
MEAIKMASYGDSRNLPQKAARATNRLLFLDSSVSVGFLGSFPRSVRWPCVHALVDREEDLR